MSLEKFGREMEKITAVRDVSIRDSELSVRFFGNVSNYNTRIGEIREKYPEVHQIGRVDGSAHQTLIFSLRQN